MDKLQIKQQLRKITILRVGKKIIVKAFREVIKFFNSNGTKKKCYVCGETFNKFSKYRGGRKKQSKFRQMLNGVGSDVENFSCMFCGCHDRERHLFMFFDKLKLWNDIRGSKVLHFAPEKHLRLKISQLMPLDYIEADISPKWGGTIKVDATDIPFDSGTFDFIIANHILEHIPDYKKALSEFYRVIKPGGMAILQTPYSKLLKHNFEDEGINSDDLRLFFHGQKDHVRTFGEHDLLESLKEAGFNLNIKKHSDYFSDDDAYYYGVSRNEDLIMVEKPQ